MDNKQKISRVMDIWRSKNQILHPTAKKNLIEIVNQMATLFTLGPFYYFVMNFENYTMDYVHHGTRDVLGLEPEEFTVEKFLELFHQKDLDKMHEKESIVGEFLFNKVAIEETLFYKVVYLIRLQHKNGTYKTILQQARAINLSDDGKIQQTLVVHTDVTYLNIPIDHKISFIGIQRPSYYATENGTFFNLNENNNNSIFTKREIDIIKRISEGKDFNEIGETLFISPHTVKTHKRNILKKSGCKNSAELVTKCLREGMI